MKEDIPIADDWLTEEELEAVRKAVGPIPKLTTVENIFEGVFMVACRFNHSRCGKCFSYSPCKHRPNLCADHG